MAHAIHPFLMFPGGGPAQAEEALTFYVSLFPGARIVALQRWGADGPGGAARAGSVMLAACELAGQTVYASDSPVQHAFGFTPSQSLYVKCEDEAELRRLAEALGQGGLALMPVGDYGFSRLFGWVQDRFGVSWQLTLE